VIRGPFELVKGFALASRTNELLEPIEGSPALKARVLRLQPCACAAADVARPAALRDNAFEVHPARITEDGATIARDGLTELNVFPHRFLRERSGLSRLLRLPKLWGAAEQAPRQLPHKKDPAWDNPREAIRESTMLCKHTMCSIICLGQFGLAAAK
jgi:hypothetical protein